MLFELLYLYLFWPWTLAPAAARKFIVVDETELLAIASLSCSKFFLLRLYLTFEEAPLVILTPSESTSARLLLLLFIKS